jgi:serine/threonine protein kinase
LDNIAHYKILDRIGESRLGELFRARDTKLGRTVAIKIPPAKIQNDQAARGAFLADARTAMTLSHPNIAALYEVGEDAGQAYLAFEFVPGESLDRVIAGHALNARRAVDLTAQIADALADAHAVEMPHGDLTSDSVIVTPKGNAKILDFGFARWTRPDGQAGSANDEAGDIRALGKLFFEMLTGRPPSASEAVPPTALNKSLPAELDVISSRALGILGEPSYQAAVTLAAELRAVAAILDVRAVAADKSRPLPVRGAARQSKAPWVAIALVAVAAALAAAWWWMR